MKCEVIFKKTTSRDPSGRFIVKIPLKLNFNLLGEIAMKRFLSLEAKLQKQPHIKQMYISFVRVYEQLGHMHQVNHSSESIQGFLPHQHVIRESSTTTKLRVVFDGSSKSCSGYSLNDLQYLGPTIQADLFAVLIRFREHRFVITADIERMYRQIIIDKSDRHLQ